MPEPLSPNGASAVSPKTADDINDLFKTLDNEAEEADKKVPTKKTTVKEPEEDEEPTEQEDELEIVEAEDEEEKLDLTTKGDDIEIDAPPRKREILAKYPDLFKTFPFLEKILFRDRQYSELFGSFDDAKEIAEKAEIFNDFEKDLLAGNTEQVLKNVKETDPKAFDKIIDNYLTTLAKVDKDAYFDVVNNVSKQLIIEMIKESNESNNDELKQAALLVNQFLFGTSKFAPPKIRASAESKDSERSEAEQERLTFIQERFETSKNDLQTRVDNTLKNTISEYIDPKGQMSAYVKKNAVADALKILHNSLGNDTALRSNLDRLWRSAFEAKFSKDSLTKIQSHYLGSAKRVLKNAIIKARAEALKDNTPRQISQETDEKEDSEQTKTPQKRGSLPAGRPPSPKKGEMKKGESVSEFFMRD